MQILSFTLPLDFNLFLTGDDHDGARLRYTAGINQLIDMVESPYEGLKPIRNYIIHHGDPIEAILIDDPRYSDLETREAKALNQIQSAIRTWSRVWKKLLVMLDGNHPLKLHKFGEITKYICEQIIKDHPYSPLRYGTFSAKISYNDRNGVTMFKHYATHGRGSIKSVADDPERAKTNMRLALKRKLKFKAGDTALMSMGHTHKLLINPPTESLYVTDDGDRLHQKYTHRDWVMENGDLDFIHPDFRWYVNSGSFMKLFGDGFSGYAEQWQMDPVELGFAVVLVREGRIVDVKKEVV